MMLVTDWNVTNMQKNVINILFCHQHLKMVTIIKSPTSLSPISAYSKKMIYPVSTQTVYDECQLAQFRIELFGPFIALGSRVFLEHKSPTKSLIGYES